MATAYQTRPRGDGRDDRPIASLVGEAASEVARIVSKEVELAKLEIREETMHVTDAAKIFGIVAGCAYLAVLMLSFAAAWGLAEVMPAGFAFLIVGLIFGIAAAIGFSIARNKAARINPVPEQTVETLKEDVEWLKQRKSSN